VIFSPNIIKTPESSRDRAKKKKREKKKKMMAPRVASKKWEVNILRGEKHFNFKNHF
jgi:hypothetical protein